MRPIVASDLMTPEVLAVSAELSVAELAAFLVDNEISGAIVNDSEGHPVGVVSLTDIAAVTADHGDLPVDPEISGFYQRRPDPSLDLEGVDAAVDGLRVADIMTPQVYSVDVDATVSEIARTLLDDHLHRLLVVDGEELVGIVSASDLLGLLIDEE